MLYRSEPLRLVAFGELGVFTKTEYRSDRLTHPVMPPTAAQGLVGSVFLHPEAKIHEGEEPRLGIEVSEIWVLNPIEHTTLCLNEVGTFPKDKVRLVDTRISNSSRQTTVVALRNPRYMVEFSYVSRDSNKMVKKGAEIFKRRLSKGQCFRQACMGRRRYPAYVEEPSGAEVPVDVDLDLGRFPWRILYSREGKQLETWEAKLRRGVLVVPSYLEAAAARGEEPRL